MNTQLLKKLEKEIKKLKELENNANDQRAVAYYRGKKEMAEDISLYCGFIKRLERTALK